MTTVQERAESLLASPLGCGFLIMAAQSGLTVREIAIPSISHHISGMAANQIGIWRSDHDDNVQYALRYGAAHADMAIAVLESGEADWWFAPCDLREQVWTPIGEVLWTPPGPELVREDTAPMSHWEKYAQKPLSLWTSTRVGDSVSLQAGMEEGAGDLSPRAYPVPCWRLETDEPVRVYEIDGPRSWHDLCVRYPASGNSQPSDIWPKRGQLVPDWRAVSAEWDAVHLSFGGWLTAEQVRNDSPEGWSLHQMWDCEFTVWLRWVFTGVERLSDFQPEGTVPQWKRGIDHMWR